MPTPDFYTINAQVIERYRAHDGEVGGAFAGAVRPQFADHQAAVDRVIPVVELVPR